MNIRPRKLVHCDSDLQTLHKQLNNDFEVHTYLHQHQLDLSNTQPYAQLLNSLILGRRTRTKHLLQLKNVKASQLQLEASAHQLEFQTIEERTGKEAEITKNLEREITQTKKSLNLLKGDIGFLVSRNQTAQLLGSKVTKVKIVAQDQLKRVTMAFTKDKEEIKIRNQMQKKFGKKLKNISNYQSTSLSRSKQFYVEGQLRLNQVYNKLYTSQQAAQNGESMALVQRQKEKIDAQNASQQLILLELSAVIQNFSLQDSQYYGNVTTLLRQIQEFLTRLQIPSDPDETQVNSAVDKILKEYNNLKESIKAMTQFYNQQLIAKEELTSKMRECQQQEHELFLKYQLQALYGYIISQDKLKSYNQKLKRFASIVKSYFKVLSYLERYEQRHEVGHTENRRYSSFSSQTNIKYSSYITQLHKTHQLLSSDQVFPDISKLCHASQEEITHFYQNIDRDVKGWLTLLKNRILKGAYYPAQRRVHQKATTYSQASQLSIPLETIQYQFSQQNSTKKAEPEATHFKTEAVSPNKAKRIRLLQDVDSDYYKMIKATMRMEKENTRKNYQFQRVFKRAKYASRDDILQEKRFQASFSVLFTKQSSPILTRTFGQQSKKNSLKNWGQTMHSTTHSSFKPKRHKIETVQELKPKIKRTIHDQRQKKTRLNQKLREALVYSAF